MPHPPIVVVVATGDVSPVFVSQVREAVSDAMRTAKERERHREVVASAVNGLPPPVRAVLADSINGLKTITIARRLGVSIRTVERRRAAALKALGVATVPEAAALLVGCGVESQPPDATVDRRSTRAA